jgi:hypothetical protein
MTFIRVPDPNLDTDHPCRSVDIKQIRDNQDDHEARLINVEDVSIRAFTHFARKLGYGSNNILNSNNPEIYYEGNFYIAATGAGGRIARNQIGESDTVDDHLIKFSGGAATNFAMAQCQVAVNFASRTKPLTFKTRIKRSNNTLDLIIGFSLWRTNFTVPNDGIYLTLGGAGTTYRFKSRNGGAETTGSDFTAIANNTWFEVTVLFENSPGNQARCYVDGLLKETFTTNLPTSDNLYGICLFKDNGDEYVDRMQVQAAGTLSDSA